MHSLETLETKMDALQLIVRKRSNFTEQVFRVDEAESKSETA